jgi:hypothetical protein
VVSDRNYRALPVDPLSVSFARRHVEGVLTGWGREDLTDNGQLVISELVSNALKATVGFYDAVGLNGGADPDAGETLMERLLADAEQGAIWIGLHQIRDSVVVEVWDCRRTPPKLSTSDENDIGGRGLELVDSLCVEWGYRWPSTGGKIVWGMLWSLAPGERVARDLGETVCGGDS